MLKWGIIIFALLASLLHHAVIFLGISFPYDWWIERALRMIPPFMYGIYCSKYSNLFHSDYKITESRVVAVISLFISTIIGDTGITILLLYICALSLWNSIPNFNLKNNFISRNNMFTVYALHEGIIIVMLAIFNKANINIESQISLMAIIAIEVIIIIISGTAFNSILCRLPSFFNVIFTGGRNQIVKEIKKN